MQPGDIRIDRLTEFGNEFVIGRDGSRADVIARFETAEPGPAGEARRRKVRAMHGRRLFCWCDPLACHGHVYARLAAELVEAATPTEGNSTIASRTSFRWGGQNMAEFCGARALETLSFDTSEFADTTMPADTDAARVATILLERGDAINVDRHGSRAGDPAEPDQGRLIRRDCAGRKGPSVGDTLSFAQ